jgi:hypothetical protein
MALTSTEKAKVRFHLGYPNVQPIQTLYAGQPQARQTLFVLEYNMDAILPEAEPIVRDLVCQLDQIECQLAESRDRMQTESVGTVKMRKDEQRALEELYQRLAFRLADVLGTPIYPLSRRFQANLTGATNIPTATNLRMVN